MRWDQLLAGRQGRVPEHLLVAFIEDNFGHFRDRDALRFLDIGPGRHASNQIFLEARGFDVFSLDISHAALKNLQADITNVDFADGSFDLIYDINTLCHVERPPLDSIRRWLRLRGRFFSIAPANDTWRGVGEGKDFTRFASEAEIIKMHDCFSGLRLKRRSYWRGDHQINSWVVEATK